MLELSLKGNDFEFNEEMYQQMCGFAMGKRFSPRFANVAKLLFYISDILIIWPHSKEEFCNLFEILNQQGDNIKLKATISDESVGFLDVTIYKGAHF